LDNGVCISCHEKRSPPTFNQSTQLLKYSSHQLFQSIWKSLKANETNIRLIGAGIFSITFLIMFAVSWFYALGNGYPINACILVTTSWLAMHRAAEMFDAIVKEKKEARKKEEV